MNYLAIFIGGGIGSVLRYLTTVFFNKNSFFSLPMGTFISNLIASLLLGLVLGFFMSKKIENEALRNLMIVGICGGFSTFSTFAYENFSFLQQNHFALSLAYITLSIIGSLLAIYIGIYFTENILSN